LFLKSEAKNLQVRYGNVSSFEQIPAVLDRPLPELLPLPDACPQPGVRPKCSRSIGSISALLSPA